MKSCFLMAIFLLSISFQAKANTVTLLQYVNRGGPSLTWASIVTIQSDGKVIYSHEIIESHRRVETQLGQLSDVAIANLKKNINNLTQLSGVIDANPHAPICENTSSTTITANLDNGKNILVFKNQGCHKYESEDPRTETLTTVMMGFVALVQ